MLPKFLYWVWSAWQGRVVLARWYHNSCRLLSYRLPCPRAQSWCYWPLCVQSHWCLFFFHWPTAAVLGSYSITGMVCQHLSLEHSTPCTMLVPWTAAIRRGCIMQACAYSFFASDKLGMDGACLLRCVMQAACRQQVVDCRGLCRLQLIYSD